MLEGISTHFFLRLNLFSSKMAVKWSHDRVAAQTRYQNLPELISNFTRITPSLFSSEKGPKSTGYFRGTSCLEADWLACCRYQVKL